MRTVISNHSRMVLLNRQHCTVTGLEDCYAQVFVDDIEAARSCTLVDFKVSRDEVFWFTHGTRFFSHLVSWALMLTRTPVIWVDRVTPCIGENFFSLRAI